MGLATCQLTGCCQEVRRVFACVLVKMYEYMNARRFAHRPFPFSFCVVPCVGVAEDESKNCFVMDGGARLYFDAAACSDAIDRAKVEIKKAMDSGAFNSLDRRILNLAYVEESDLQLTSTDKTVQSGEDSGGNSTSLPGWAWGIIGAGSFVFLSIILYVCCKARRPKEDGDEMRAPLGQAGESDSDYVDYDPPASDHENPYYDSQERQSTTSSQAMTDDSMLPPMEETSGEDTD